MNYQIIDLDAFILNGVYREFTKETLPSIFNFWETLDMEGTIEHLHTINDFKAIDGFLGACLKQIPSDNLRYLVSVASTTPHQDYTSVEIPASKWVVFDVSSPLDHDISKTMIQAFENIYQNWFKTQPYRPLPLADLEFYQQSEHDGPSGLSMKIYIPIEAI